MTIAGRISFAVGTVALLSAGLLSVLLCVQQYQDARELLLQQISTTLASRPQLPADVHLQDTEQLNSFLGELQDLSPAIRHAAILDTNGRVLAQRGMRDPAPYADARFGDLRGQADVMDASTAEIDYPAPPPEAGIAGRLLGGDQVMYQLTPLFSLINPLQPGLTRRDFGIALTASTGQLSRHVIGYVQVAISRGVLVDSALPSLTLIVVAPVLFALLCVLVARLATGPMTRSLGRLADAAENIALGQTTRTVKVSGGGEISRMSKALNSMIESLSQFKTRSDVDQQLLRMKVDERTEQLSARNQELNQAVKQVTEAKDRLRHMAYYDSLTSLPNRRLFTEQLNLLLKLSRRNNQMLALLFLDLDNFKRINDSLGHAAGDLMLKEVAQRLSSSVRESDVVAHFDESENRLGVSRLGGDEFTVVLNQLDSPARAGQIAERIMEALLAPIVIEGHEVVVTPSIGIAVSPADGSDLEELLQAADTAMYHAKRSGKGNYLFYNSDMDSVGVDRLELETDLRRAIEREQLRVLFQPQVDTRNGTVTGVEALLRWEHPERGTVSPGLFVPLAEELGLIGELGQWCLHRACTEIQALLATGSILDKVAVNVSAMQFSSNFDEVVAGALQATGLPAERLSLELTEGIAVDTSSQTLELLQRIRQLGVRLSIDDFGTGYSSLSYLSRFPLDELKIDRSFVVGLGESEEQASLVSAIIAMGKSLGLELVAEGVETEDQYHFLTRNGAHVIQGFMFSKPIPVEELHRLLDRGHFAAQIMDMTGVILESPAQVAATQPEEESST